MAPVSGLLCLDKPVGPTSYDIVHLVKKSFATRKVGHAGTLDPGASGVLVVAINNATRLLPYLPTEPKAYRFSVQFGSETDTLDNTGKTVNTSPVIPSEQTLRGVLDQFKGTIGQVPPHYSAVKISGKRAYALARKNIDFEISARQVTVFSLELTQYDEQLGSAHFSLTCSSGTYVRSLARDIAYAAGSLGHTTAIARTGVGPFSLESAQSTAYLAQAPHECLIGIKEATHGLAHLVASAGQLRELSFGRPITPKQIDDKTGAIILIFDQQTELAAICKKNEQGLLLPLRVFCRPEHSPHGLASTIEPLSPPAPTGHLAG